MDRFVREEVEPLDQMGFSPYDVKHPLRAALFPPLQQKVREQGLWACHLGPELGGPGYGQMKLALMNMILGRSSCASKVFGTAAPDTGNSEILAHFGTPEQKKFKLRAVQDPSTGEWVLNGEKIWSSNAKYASFFIVVAVTDPDVKNPYRRQSTFLVDAKNPGLRILR